MEKLLITGGLGFMGYHLIQHLLEQDDSLLITVVDNLSSSQIEFGELYSKLNVIIDDFRTVDDLSDDFDFVYHLASPVGSLGILQKNGYVAREIIELTYKAIEITERCDAKLLFVSSSEVYGRAGIHKELTDFYLKNNIGTRSEYALGKLISEIILQNISQNKKIRYNICRPFNIIGEQQSSRIGFVVPTFFENALQNKSIPVFYDGLQKRAFCHVSDIVKAFIKIQKSNIENEIFNIGNNSNIVSILELAHLIKKMCNSESEIIHIDPVEMFGKLYIEAFDKIPDIIKAKELFNWEPIVDLKSSLMKMLEYYKDKNEYSFSKPCLSH